jgi:CheY-like chemotaxis protein
MARILVIDDDALIRETLKTMLQLERHEVALAPHGEEGVVFPRTSPIRICDTFMPRRQHETIAAIRSASRCHRSPPC